MDVPTHEPLVVDEPRGVESAMEDARVAVGEGAAAEEKTDRIPEK